MKRKYGKPQICGSNMVNSMEQIAPLSALAPAAALLAGYAAGRSVRKAMEALPQMRQRSLMSVLSV